MRHTFSMPLAVVVALLLAPALCAGEAAQGGESDQQAKMKALEERVQKLEDALARERGSRVEPRNKWRPGPGLGPDMDQLLEQMQRQMQRGFPGGQWQWNFGGGDFPQGLGYANKPRLGVQLDAPSDELRERFKNDTREGAFVTEIVPGSPAEKGGLNVGDCITSFNSRDIKSPADLIDAVKAAPQGKADIIVTRRGEALKLKVELGEPQDAAKVEDNDIGQPQQRGWLRRGDGQGRAAAKSHAEVKASALELSDQLAKDLKLTDEQKKKMREVLAKHSQALSGEAAIRAEKGARRGGSTFSMNGDVSRLVDKHVAEAEKELDGTLSPEQLKQWADHRKHNSSLSFSQTITEGGGGPAEADTGDETMNF